MSPSPWDCHACQTEGSGAYRPPALRRLMHCGWMDRAEWSREPQFPKNLGGGLVPYTVDVCPGWLIAMPIVREAGGVADIPEGEVLAYYPDGEVLPLEARRTARRARDLYQFHRMKSKEN